MDKRMDEIIERQLLKERDQIAENIQKNQAITSQELEKLDKIYHALKSQATYCAMKEATEYDEDGMSGRRGRDSNGRYTSRESRDNMSFNEGYDRGYSEAMSRMHIPTIYRNTTY